MVADLQIRYSLNINREGGRFAPRNTQAIIERSHKFADRLASAIRNRAPVDSGTLRAGIRTQPDVFTGDLRSINAKRLVLVTISTTTNRTGHRLNSKPREYAPFVEANTGFVAAAFESTKF